MRSLAASLNAVPLVLNLGRRRFKMSLIYLMISAQAAAKALMRVCPACGKKQIVASADKNQAVSCRNCGKPIAPSNAG